MSKKIDYSRREFLLKSTLLSASTIAAPFALNLFQMNMAAAATEGDYKALVCVFLGGGNDHNNTVIATDARSWAGYLAARDTGGNASILLRNTDGTPRVRDITPSNEHGVLAGYDNSARKFGLHPNMPELQALFTDKKVAIVANVGPLIEPLTADDRVNRFDGKVLPFNLFSHSDQTSQWSNTNPAITEKNYGWGGKIADAIRSKNGFEPFTSLSLSGNNLFLAGKVVNQYQINSSGVPVPVTGFTNFGLNPASLQTLLTTPFGNNKFELDHTEVVKRAIASQASLDAVMKDTNPSPRTGDPVATREVPAPTLYTNPNTPLTPQANPLATQLHTVARIIAGRTNLQAHRQVFFVTLGGFDTHDFQAGNHANLMARLSHGIDYFYKQMITLPGGDMSNNVTLFTASDFGRTFSSNGDGTDHGWGAHHFVVGGAVKGGDIYGAFPETGLNRVTGTTFSNPLDVGSGSTVPMISVDQYAGTLAKWFGLTPTEITGTISTPSGIFPNLAKWETTTTGNGTDLKFMV